LGLIRVWEQLDYVAVQPGIDYQTWPSEHNPPSLHTVVKAAEFTFSIAGQWFLI
jgi:hypothetical protein